MFRRRFERYERPDTAELTGLEPRRTPVQRRLLRHQR